MLCFRCGHNNPQTSVSIRFCDKCNTRLPDKAEETKVPEKKQKTERLEKIISMGNNFINKICSREAFLDFLKKQKTSLEKTENNFKSLDIPEELKEEFHFQIKTNLEGIYLYKKSVEIMKEATSKEMNSAGIKEAILRAIEYAKEGNDKINKCYKMSEEKLRQIKYETPRYKN